MSANTMSKEEVAAYCRSLPGVKEDIKWGGVHVFFVDQSKMFALFNLNQDGLSFKVEKDLFLGYVDRPGIHPSPYLARAHWINMKTPYPMATAELQDLLRRSHQLVVSKLPKKRQIGLLL
ncbi:MmcQ/YjbR family DNA-binding protein [Pseudomonas weihenstephanensis]|uniref:MmcQ/YjbR family DNA-binding protein n=2 Tax=Pseudomonas weihenstephanensis TaxID=1608994 RepID=A0A0J6IIY7_9PSED|nr:MmcQ/YjbR family DNA-binding protein [Pseudomonas weihenstephanensis]KMN12278.1 hypothetical protein TU86_18655 [Pseudomonas weihenstephanensis]KMN16149.1 hypothetical protein TU87_22210 [Pseudomonas weihenstephanensis]GLX91304.1 hypothetical protein Pfra02_38720 [Pseudomonas fragi]